MSRTYSGWDGWVGIGMKISVRTDSMSTFDSNKFGFYIFKKRPKLFTNAFGQA